MYVVCLFAVGFLFRAVICLSLHDKLTSNGAFIRALLARLLSIKISHPKNSAIFRLNSSVAEVELSIRCHRCCSQSELSQSSGDNSTDSADTYECTAAHERLFRVVGMVRDPEESDTAIVGLHC